MPFPGNVRELENILERAITMSTGGEIRAADIQLRPSPVGSHSMAEAQRARLWVITSRTSSARRF